MAHGDKQAEAPAIPDENGKVRALHLYVFTNRSECAEPVFGRILESTRVPDRRQIAERNRPVSVVLNMIRARETR